MRSEICTAERIALDEMLDQSRTVNADFDSKDGVSMSRYCATGVLASCEQYLGPRVDHHWRIAAVDLGCRIEGSRYTPNRVGKEPPKAKAMDA